LPGSSPTSGRSDWLRRQVPQILASALRRSPALASAVHAPWSCLGAVNRIEAAHGSPITKSPWGNRLSGRSRSGGRHPSPDSVYATSPRGSRLPRGHDGWAQIARIRSLGEIGGRVCVDAHPARRSESTCPSVGRDPPRPIWPGNDHLLLAIAARGCAGNGLRTDPRAGGTLFGRPSVPRSSRIRGRRADLPIASTTIIGSSAMAFVGVRRHSNAV